MTFKLKLLLPLAVTLASLSAEAERIYLTGSSTDVETATSGAICLAGGGSDDEWSEGWKYMLNKANGGDVVIIRADGSRGEYEDWIYNDKGNHDFPKSNSVQTISLKKAEDANLSSIEGVIKKAEMIFFAGGDQTIYENWFKGSKLAAAVEYAMKIKKVPIGGTSAGMAILAGIDFTGAYASPNRKNSLVNSDDVMKNPTGQFVDLKRDLFNPPFLNEIVTDTHFSQRNRQGRLLGFMARAVYNNYGDINMSNIKGIAADEGTAYCFNEKGSGKVFGSNSVFFLKGNLPIERIVPGLSLNWLAGNRAVRVYEIKGSNSVASTFDVSTWSGTGGSDQYWWVDGTNVASPIFGRSLIKTDKKSE